jgi:hypothetical protein
MSFLPRRAFAGSPPFADHMRPAKGQCQQANEPFDPPWRGQMGLFEPVSPRFERCKHGLDFPATPVEHRRLPGVDPESGQDKEAIVGLFRSGSDAPDDYLCLDLLSTRSMQITRSAQDSLVANL